MVIPFFGLNQDGRDERMDQEHDQFRDGKSTIL